MQGTVETSQIILVVALGFGVLFRSLTQVSELCFEPLDNRDLAVIGAGTAFETPAARIGGAILVVFRITKACRNLVLVAWIPPAAEGVDCLFVSCSVDVCDPRACRRSISSEFKGSAQTER